MPHSIRVLRDLIFAGVVLVLVLAAPPFASGAAVRDSARGVSFAVPEGFVETPQAREQLKALYVFTRPAAGEEKLPTAIVVKGMGGTLDREPLRGVRAPDGKPVAIEKTRWKSFDVSLAPVPETVNGRPALDLTVQVPIRGEAIQVTVFGDASREAELRSILAAFLAGLDGPSNWRTEEEERGYRLGRILGQLTALVLGGYCLWWVVVKGRRRAA